MAHSTIEQKVTTLVEEKIAGMEGLFLVEVKMLPSRKLMILVDGDEGIGIADCAAISRFVGFKLEEENTIEEAYNLEVSSPGIDAPLVLQRQYHKNIGRELSLKMIDGILREGILTGLEDDTVIIEEKIKAVKKTAVTPGKKAEIVQSRIPLDTIAETKVLISFK